MVQILSAKLKNKKNKQEVDIDDNANRKEDYEAYQTSLRVEDQKK